MPTIIPILVVLKMPSIENILDEWDKSFEYGIATPKYATIRMFARRLLIEDIIDAIDITAGKFSSANSSSLNYFYGVCWGKIKDKKISV